ncbi:MAG: hypothetical protein EOO74_00665 [Myxococcales bacterium]|nr:MAG: hypothetical protein EOO74_00665 [Myxococcales bacterium]
MANFDRTIPDTRVDGMTIFAEEVKDIDRKVCKTLNVVDGCVAAPLGNVSIGGTKTWSFTCLVKVETILGADANFTDSVSYGVLSGGDIYCGSIQSSGDVSASGQLSGDSLFIANGATLGAIQTPTGGNANIGGNCAVAGDLEAGATSVASLSCSGPSQFAGPTTLAGTTTVSSSGALNIKGASTLEKPMKHVGKGRQQVRVLVVTNPADSQVFSVEDYSVILVPAGVMPDNRNFKLLNGSEGDMVRLVNRDSNYAVIFRDENGTSIAPLVNTSNQKSAVDVVFSGGVWLRAD